MVQKLVFLFLFWFPVGIGWGADPFRTGDENYPAGLVKPQENFYLA